ncbi:unnamed protein product [Nezara viridula]|uniref:Uncharacterized protein n=1 Tax=Nezara viridula TaxID=85310 RepID=A0A9P0H4E2_NEZVI|nr:unnamed protein product [Nezara viridula]
MNRKPKDPPKAVFKYRRISICELEKPKAGVLKDWIEELDAVEERIKHFVSLDMGRIRTICDDVNEYERVCNALELEIPRGELGPTMDYSLHNFPIIGKRKTAHKKRAVHGKKHIEESEEGSSKITISSEIGDAEFRKTLFESAMVRASTKKSHVSPYRANWSEESIDECVEYKSEPTESSSVQSLETIGYLSEDLFVNPAKSQNTELLEPLEEAKSPYQKFFSRSVKEVREHVDRLRKKKFHTLSEKVLKFFLYIFKSFIIVFFMTVSTILNIYLFKTLPCL